MAEADHGRLLERLQARIGTTTPAVTTRVDASMIRRFVMAIGDPQPLYLDEAYAQTTRFGSIVAPPTFVAAFVDTHFPEIVVQDLPFATMLHSDDEIRLNRLIRLGDVITAQAHYAGARLSEGKNGPRLYQSADLVLTASNQEQVASVRITTISF